MDNNNNIDLIIEDFRNKILEIIQTSNLAPSIIFYLFKDIYNMVEKDYNNYVNILNQQKEKEEIKKMTQDLDELSKNIESQDGNDQEED